MIEVWLVLIAVWCVLVAGRLAQHRHVVAVVWLAGLLWIGRGRPVYREVEVFDSHTDV